MMTQTANAADSKAERNSGSRKASKPKLLDETLEQAQRQRSSSLKKTRSGKKSRKKDIPQLATLEARKRNLERMVQHCEQLQARVLSNQMPTVELLRLNQMYNSGVEDAAVSFTIDGEQPPSSQVDDAAEVVAHPLLQATAWQTMSSPGMASTGLGDSAWLEASLSQAMQSMSAQQLDCLSLNASIEETSTPFAAAAAEAAAAEVANSPQRPPQTLEVKQAADFFSAASPGSARSVSLSPRSATGRSPSKDEFAAAPQLDAEEPAAAKAVQQAWATITVEEASELAQQKQTVEIELEVMRGQLQALERQRVEELALKDLEIEALRLGVLEVTDDADESATPASAVETPQEHPEMKNLRAALDALREHEERCETSKEDLAESKEHTQKLLHQLREMKEQMQRTTTQMQGELLETRTKLDAYEVLGSTEVVARLKVAAAELPHLKHFKTTVNLEVERLRSRVQEQEQQLIAELAEKERQQMDELSRKDRQHVEELALKERQRLDEVAAKERQRIQELAQKDEELEAIRLEADQKLEEEQAPVVELLPIPEDVQRQMTNLQNAMDTLQECEERCMSSQDTDSTQEEIQKLLEQMKEMREQTQKTTSQLQGELADARTRLGAYEALGSVEVLSRCRVAASEVPKLKQLQKSVREELDAANLKVQEKERQRVAELAQKESKHMEELALQKRRGVEDLAKKDRQRLEELGKKEAELLQEVKQRDAEIEALRLDMEELHLLSSDEEQAAPVAPVPEHIEHEMQNLRDALNKMHEVEKRYETGPDGDQQKGQENEQRLLQQVQDLKQQMMKTSTQMQGELAESRKKLQAYEALGTTEALARCKAASSQLPQLKQFKKSANKELEALRAKVQEKDRQRLEQLADKDRKKLEELAERDRQRFEELAEKDRKTRMALAEKDSELEAMRSEVEAQRLLAAANEQATEPHHAEHEAHGMQMALETLKEYEDRWDTERAEEEAKSEETTKQLLAQFRDMREQMKKATSRLQGELAEVRKKLRAYQALGSTEVFARCKAAAAENTDLREFKTKANKELTELRSQAQEREVRHKSQLALKESDMEALRIDVELAKSAADASSELCTSKDAAASVLRTKLAAYEELGDVGAVMKWRQASVELRELKKFRNQVNIELDELRYQATSVVPLPESIEREAQNLRAVLKRIQEGDRRLGSTRDGDLEKAEEMSQELLQQLQEMKQQMLGASSQMRGELSEVRKKLGAYEALGTTEALARCKEAAAENAQLTEFKNKASKELEELRSRAQDREVRHLSEIAQNESEMQALRRSAAELARSAAEASSEMHGDKGEATSILRTRLAAYEELGDVSTLMKWKQSAAELRKMKRFRNQVNIELDDLRFQVEELERERDELVEREQRLGLKYKQLDIFKLVEVSRSLKTVDTEIGDVGKQVTLLQNHTIKIAGEAEQIAFKHHVDKMMQQCIGLRSKVRELLTQCVGDAQRVQQVADSGPAAATSLRALPPAASARALPAPGVGSARNVQSSGYPVPVSTS